MYQFVFDVNYTHIFPSFHGFTTNSLFFLFGSIGSHPMLRPGRVCYTIQTAGVLSSFPGIYIMSKIKIVQLHQNILSKVIRYEAVRFTLCAA